MKKYKCIEDLLAPGDNEGWCVGITMTDKEWGKKAYEWACIDGWKPKPKFLLEWKEDQLMNYIAEIWNLKFIEG